ncbi:MAG: GNAT family N-acetyltransferase [Candidatus Eremiobacteraeota bacterium]|nr:GNAT family N-acetyltransferase [Candidatus Eremiobacteraeota bacterium]
MELHTKRLWLREPTLEDAPLLVRLYGDAEVQKTLPQLEPVTVERMRETVARNSERWDKEGSGMFVVFEKDSGDFAGCSGHLFWDIDGVHETEVAYAIMPAHWRKGYATEAALALKEDAFTRLDRKRVISLVMPGNVGSEKVAKNNGMQIEKQTVLLARYNVNVWAVAR